ncbi:translation initiation factor IF-2 N-terminal domain-containing protein, partial [Streptococcus suis]|uniref:translation initiation factor IF-2 N-terminal domain-containing protein n=1 Tax=Streptococcus suis TaxID=1307 RepID=UPI0018758D27
MSKKRLNEIARELGVSSKEVVAKAQELGFEVKSHASSVDEASAKRLADSFTKKVEAQKTVEKVQSVEKATESKAPVVKQEVPAPATKEEPKAVASAAPHRPQSRNFKAEREARAKEQAAKRAQGKGGQNKQGQ